MLRNNSPADAQLFLKGVRIVTIIGFLIVFGIIFYTQWWPKYVVLDIPTPNLKCIYSVSEEKTTAIGYSGNKRIDSQKTWVWRKLFDFTPNCDNFDNSEKILAYFDKWLNDSGWVKYEQIGFPCGGMMNEGDFLERGKDLFAYVPQGTTNIMSAPAVCVSIWPYNIQDNATGYMVLLTTSTP
jgi:hypothetical protein